MCSSSAKLFTNRQNVQVTCTVFSNSSLVQCYGMMPACGRQEGWGLACYPVELFHHRFHDRSMMQCWAHVRPGHLEGLSWSL